MGDGVPADAVLSKGHGEEDYGGKADGTEFAHAKGGGERGENYLHWRRDKDAEETRLRGLADRVGQLRGRPTSTSSTQGMRRPLYGETHLVLKDSVAPHAVQLRTVRMLHSDLLPAMADIIRQLDTPNYAGVAPKYPKSEFIDVIVANAMKTGDVHTSTTSSRGRIFGDLDLKTDVAAISTPKGEFKTTGQMRNSERLRRPGSRPAQPQALRLEQRIKVIEWDARRSASGPQPEGAGLVRKAEFAAKVARRAVGATSTERAQLGGGAGAGRAGARVAPGQVGARPPAIGVRRVQRRQHRAHALEAAPGGSGGDPRAEAPRRSPPKSR